MAQPHQTLSRKPRVSIGLPVYNGENYLAIAIESILAQTYWDFELIISDNASTDATPSICHRYEMRDRRIRYFRNERNIGASENFNITFRRASGEYFRWAAHDDELAPNCLERCVAALENEKDAVLAQPFVGMIDAKGRVTAILDNDEELQQAGSSRASDRFASMISPYRPCHEAFGLIRRDALTKTALIAPFPWSDVVLIAELALLGRFVVVPEVLFFNRQHPARFTSSAIFDRQAAWHWWCVREGKAKSLFDLCPNWQVKIALRRIIDKHLADQRERRRARLALFRHVITPRVLIRLIFEPFAALDPRLLAIARSLKSCFTAPVAPDLPIGSEGWHAESRK